MLAIAQGSLDDDKGEDVVVIDLAGRSSMADYLIIGSGRSSRHVGAMAENLRERLKATGVHGIEIEGMPHCDWVLIDAGDVIVHLFRPEVRLFYNLEKMWGVESPLAARAALTGAGAIGFEHASDEGDGEALDEATDGETDGDIQDEFDDDIIDGSGPGDDSDL
ncbi:MAG: ribosome silencing factor [Rhodospirillaceae bacterium]